MKPTDRIRLTDADTTVTTWAEFIGDNEQDIALLHDIETALDAGRPYRVGIGGGWGATITREPAPFCSEHPEGGDCSPVHPRPRDPMAERFGRGAE